MIAPCPHCGAEYDCAARTSGDVVWCRACDKWSTVRHQNGGQAVLTKRDEPPVSWPRKSGKVRRP